MLVAGSVNVSASIPTCTYSVDTYSDGSYSTLQDMFYQGDTVYAKGLRINCPGDAEALKLKFYDSNDDFVDDCIVYGANHIECDLDLENDAPTGEWTVELWRKFYGQWSDKADATFTVNIVPEEPTCELTVEDFEGKGSYSDDGMEYFDSEAVPIDWHVTEDCTPVDMFYIWYAKDGSCDPNTGSWHQVPGAQNLAPGDVEHPSFPDYLYTWDRPMESGQYCVKVKVTSNGARGVSEKFNVDLAPPVVSLDLDGPQSGECEAHETGDCYINQDTEITVDCSDDNPDAPWQSGVDDMEYRYKVNEGEWTQWMKAPDSFSFEEDSNHLLQYRCYDNVGKVDEGEKAFIVESDAPHLERTVTGPQVCPEGGEEECMDYFNLDTEICVDLTDLPEHTVPGIGIWCHWDWHDDETKGVKSWFEVDGCFNYEEDSWHTLECKVVDSLGNTYIHEPWFDIVDAKAPIIDVTVGDPKYENDGLYVSDETKICVSAEDDMPHPVGWVELGCEYDWKQSIEDDWTNMGALNLDEEGCFYFGENSYHQLRCSATDGLDNEAELNQVFIVDTLLPEPTKIVGEPSSQVDYEPMWNWYENEGQNVEWEVTVDTPITISCQDTGNHPSGIKGIHYRIVWDGKYEDDSAAWQFEKGDSKTLWFGEDSEHLLEFWCEDNLGQRSRTDSEIFKVTGDSFTLEIGDKWDLISVPFNLIGGGDIEEVFGDNSDILEVWSYENGEWKVYSGEGPQTLDKIEPGRGYWVKTTDSVEIIIGGSLMLPQSMPPSVELEKGWNLIGHYGLSSKPAYCSLFSLVDTQQGFPRWSALWGYESSSQSFVPLDSWSFTNAGEGYWIEMDIADSYSPSSVCWGFPIQVEQVI